MAKLSKFAVFWRVFLISLLAGVPAGTKKVRADDSSDWARASSTGTKEAIIWYLRRNPAGDHIEEAIDTLVGLDAKAAPLSVPQDAKVDDTPRKRREGGTDEGTGSAAATAIY